MLLANPGSLLVVDTRSSRRRFWSRMSDNIEAEQFGNDCIAGRHELVQRMARSD